MPKRRLAFIKSGSFSHINAALLGELTRHFPELEVEEIDVWSDILAQRRRVYWMAVADAAMRYGRKLLRHRRALPQIALRTPYLFRRLRELIGERLSERLAEFRFTFQTQSLFDASLPGVPHFVFTDHTHLANLRYPAFGRNNLFPWPWPLLEPEIYHHARHIFVMSEHVKDSLTADYGIASDRVTTVFGGSNVGRIDAPLQNANYGNRTIVFVGVDWERKGGAKLAEAFARVRAELPDARLIVVGCRPGLGMPGCEEVGKVPPDQVWSHLSRASVFCLPTLVEPFGLAVVEAFSFRLPVVVSDVGAMPTLVRNGETGIIVPAEDAEALANALLSLLRDPERCRRFGQAGRGDVEERYSWASVGKRLHAGISAVLN